MISKSDPDFRLVQKARSGHSIAFGKLVEKYQDRILDLVYDFTGDYDKSKDIAQDVFLKVFVKISSFEGKSSFATWLYRVTINTCLDDLRKTKKKSFLIFSNSDEMDKIEDKSLADDSEVPDIDLKMNKLSKQQRTAILLRFYNDMTIAEISQIMECSDNTVRTHIYRAVEKLKKR
jgi:RNA polymerase sigma-70 factor (ECF subfamily)